MQINAHDIFSPLYLYMSGSNLFYLLFQAGGLGTKYPTAKKILLLFLKGTGDPEVRLLLVLPG